MPTTPLTLIPAKVRLIIYLALFLVALVLTCAAAYFQTLELPVPDVIRGVAGALVPATAVFSAVAAANTTNATAPQTAIVQAPADVELRVDGPQEGYGEGV